MSNTNKKGMFWLWALLLAFFCYFVLYFANSLYVDAITSSTPPSFAYQLYDLLGWEGMSAVPIVITAVSQLIFFVVWFKLSARRYYTKGVWKFYTIGFLIVYRILVNIGGFNELRMANEQGAGYTILTFTIYAACAIFDMVFRIWFYSSKIKALVAESSQLDPIPEHE